MSVLRSAFSKAVILLCQLHVIKYLQGEIVDGHYAFNPWQKEQLRGLMVLLVYSKSERGYEKYLPYVWHVIKVRGSLTAQRESQQQVVCPVEQAVYSI
ncbi:hypothetical protein PC121_g11428 [Phytophthora cactorum]|nr:hypothetical protein PC121_g11428 [Phytophthora cactorum]